MSIGDLSLESTHEETSDEFWIWASYLERAHALATCSISSAAPGALNFLDRRSNRLADTGSLSLTV